MGPAKSMLWRDQGESGTGHEESVDLRGDLAASCVRGLLAVYPYLANRRKHVLKSSCG